MADSLVTQVQGGATPIVCPCRRPIKLDTYLLYFIALGLLCSKKKCGRFKKLYFVVDALDHKIVKEYLSVGERIV